MSSRIIGAGMTSFARHPEHTLRDLALEASRAALHDAGIEPRDVEAAVVGNAMAGLMTGQESVRGQAALRGLGLAGVPIVNVENACASGATALHVADSLVASGRHDCLLVVGVEKLYDEDRTKTMAALAGAVEVTAESAGMTFMEIYAQRVRAFMSAFGATPAHLARIASKNRAHGALNPYAGFRSAVSPDEVLASPLVAEPLRRLMCCPITDGAAAVVVCSEAFARRRAVRAVAIRASVLVSGAPNTDETNENVVTRAATRAYEHAGLGPVDVDVFEVHDAASSGELLSYASLGLCAAGDEQRLVDDGVTALGGRAPFNPSGGLQSKGNPSGATGIAQVVELVWQLRGDADDRQVPGARVALAENAGGMVDDRTAAVCVHVLAA